MNCNNSSGIPKWKPKENRRYAPRNHMDIFGFMNDIFGIINDIFG
jgi:hypothetical protein